MTIADFVAGSFWPVMILFFVALWLFRESPAWRLVLIWAVGTLLLYLGLLFVYGVVSLAVMIDQFIGAALLGVAAFAVGAGRWSFALDGNGKWKAAALMIFGIGCTAIGGSVLCRDFALPREVIEGRVDRVFTSGGRSRGYNVRIAGRTMKTIIPDYERLALLPLVRVEVGRGSEYIYKIQYLAN